MCNNIAKNKKSRFQQRSLASIMRRHKSLTQQIVGPTVAYLALTAISQRNTDHGQRSRWRFPSSLVRPCGVRQQWLWWWPTSDDLGCGQPFPNFLHHTSHSVLVVLGVTLTGYWSDGAMRKGFLQAREWSILAASLVLRQWNTLPVLVVDTSASLGNSQRKLAGALPIAILIAGSTRARIQLLWSFRFCILGPAEKCLKGWQLLCSYHCNPART